MECAGGLQGGAEGYFADGDLGVGEGRNARHGGGRFVIVRRI
ncbi:MAG: hypothetical protein ACI84R_000337 [Candidatus Azotimanducaceae bacterium]|jgi:hypothetical protein